MLSCTAVGFFGKPMPGSSNFNLDFHYCAQMSTKQFQNCKMSDAEKTFARSSGQALLYVALHFTHAMYGIIILQKTDE